MECTDWKIVADLSKGRKQAVQEETFDPKMKTLRYFEGAVNIYHSLKKHNIPGNINFHPSNLQRAVS